GSLTGIGPSGKVVPSRSSRGFGVRRDDANTGSHEIVPVADPLRVTLANDEDDRRCIRRTIVRQAVLPIDRDATGLRRDRVDIVGQRKRGDIAAQAIDDRTGLFSGASMRLLNFDAIPRSFLPVAFKELVVFYIQLAGGIVRHVE